MKSEAGQAAVPKGGKYLIRFAQLDTYSFKAEEQSVKAAFCICQPFIK